MRVCRFIHHGQVEYGFFLDDESILPLAVASERYGIVLPAIGHILELFPGGAAASQMEELSDLLDATLFSGQTLKADSVQLLVPVPDPGKIILLAGNYAAHVKESGGQAAERSQTFPYLFMKPPATTLTHPGDPIRIPAISPSEIDWEVELGVVIGTRCAHVREAEALNYVAGYTVVNDISDRAFPKGPQRVNRPKDSFFDWQHGKWHDTFCPMGPCLLSTQDCPDPQNLRLTLTVNGVVEQDGTTADMVFPVAAIVEFISSFVTLLPGDIISTGTPDGVGKAKGKFLKPGDMVEACIPGIGTLRNPVV